MLYAVDLWKSYGSVQALRGVDLTIEPGEIVGLLGSNGAGKSTLISIIAGLLRPGRGSVRVSGIDVQQRPKETKRLIGLVPQELGIYPSISVKGNLEFFGQLGGLARNQLKSEIAKVSEALNLTGLLNRFGRDLSGGEKRRLHTAVALLHRPRLLLLDEPTVGADVETRANVLEVIRELASAGTAICYTTHYLPEIEALGASVAILEQGEIIVRGSLKELISQHGVSTVNLMFNGITPDLGPEFAAVKLGSSVCIRTNQPAATAANVLSALGGKAGSLQALEIMRPDLNSVYWSLTGKRYSGDGGGTQEGTNVVAS